MNVRVQYMSQLRAAIGRNEEVVELADGSRVLGLLEFLASRNPEARPHLLTDVGTARPSLIIVVDDQTVPARDAAVSELRSDAVVTLLPPIAGG